MGRKGNTEVNYKGRIIERYNKKYVWCSYFQRYFPEEEFYNNSANYWGKQTECIPVSRWRASFYRQPLKFYIKQLSTKEQKLFLVN